MEIYTEQNLMLTKLFLTTEILIMLVKLDNN